MRLTHLRALALVQFAACAPVYQPATLSTLTPRTRVTLTDSTRLELQAPEVRGDSLRSATRPAIPLDSVARVEAQQPQNEVLGVLVGVVLAGVLIGATSGGE